MPTSQKMTHIIKLKKSKIYQIINSLMKYLISFHFSLTHKDGLKPYYFITRYFWLKTAFSDFNIPLKGIIILKAHSTTLQNIYHIRSIVLTASSTSMHKCVPGSALFSRSFIFCISLYRLLKVLYASRQFLHTSE